MFLASWSLDPRAITDQAAAAGLATANRIKTFQFTSGQPRVRRGVGVRTYREEKEGQKTGIVDDVMVFTQLDVVFLGGSLGRSS